MSQQHSQNDFAERQPSAAFLQAVRGLQVITLALAMGSAFIAGIMCIVNQGDTSGQAGVLSIVGFAMAALHFVAHAAVPKLIMAKQLESITRSDLQSMNTEDQQMTVLTSMRAGHIIGSAILEGAVVINAIAYLIEKWIGSLAIAGVFIVLIILRLPSVYGTLNKVNDRIREIEMS